MAPVLTCDGFCEDVVGVLEVFSQVGSEGLHHVPHHIVVENPGGKIIHHFFPWAKHFLVLCWACSCTLELVDFQIVHKNTILDMFCWDLKYVGCPEHEIHKIKCLTNKNNFTVYCHQAALHYH